VLVGLREWDRVTAGSVQRMETLHGEGLTLMTEVMSPIAYYSRIRVNLSLAVLIIITWGTIDPRLAEYAVYTRALDNELVYVKYLVSVILMTICLMSLPIAIRSIFALPALEANSHLLRIHSTWRKDVKLTPKIKSSLRSSSSFGLPMSLYRDRERVASELRHILRE
jgi:hypothetical protein